MNLKDEAQYIEDLKSEHREKRFIEASNRLSDVLFSDYEFEEAEALLVMQLMIHQICKRHWHNETVRLSEDGNADC